MPFSHTWVVYGIHQETLSYFAFCATIWRWGGWWWSAVAFWAPLNCWSLSGTTGKTTYLLCSGTQLKSLEDSPLYFFTLRHSPLSIRQKIPFSLLFSSSLWLTSQHHHTNGKDLFGVGVGGNVAKAHRYEARERKVQGCAISGLKQEKERKRRKEGEEKGGWMTVPLLWRRASCESRIKRALLEKKYCA